MTSNVQSDPSPWLGVIALNINAKSDVASDALAAISRHQGNHAFQVLAEVVESQADYDLREEAIFWMVMSETENAFAYIDRLIMGE